jgi:hypothetical protein
MACASAFYEMKRLQAAADRQKRKQAELSPHWLSLVPREGGMMYVCGEK